MPIHSGLTEGQETILLKDIAEALNEANDITHAMDALLPRLSQVLGLTTAWAFRFDPARGTFVEVGASGLPPALAADDARALKSSWCECQDRLVKGRLDTAVNIVRCSRLRDAVGDRQGLKFHASIPMRMKGNPLGILNVAASGARAFTGPALNLLRAIGYHVAVTIDRAALVSDIKLHAKRLEALTDIARDLTGIMDEDTLLTRAIQLFQERLGYDAVGLMADGQLKFHVTKTPSQEEPEYSYHDATDPQLIPIAHVILADARAGITQDIPRSRYQVRLESRTPQAFVAADEELLAAYTWHISALLDQVSLHHQGLAAARWSERQELAADLHDSVSQRLFSAHLLTRTLERRLPDDADAISLASRLAEVIRESQQDMKRLVDALRTNRQPLAEAIRYRLQRLVDFLEVPLHWDLAEVSVDLTAEREEALLHMLDEALQNSLKHAPGAPVHVALENRAGGVWLEVRDFGPGFDAARQTPGHHGIQTLSERAHLHQLRLTIDTAPGQGTTVCIFAPGSAG